MALLCVGVLAVSDGVVFCRRRGGAGAADGPDAAHDGAARREPGGVVGGAGGVIAQQQLGVAATAQPLSERRGARGVSRVGGSG